MNSAVGFCNTPFSCKQWGVNHESTGICERQAPAHSDVILLSLSECWQMKGEGHRIDLILTNII